MAYTREQTPQELDYDDVRAALRQKWARVGKRVVNKALAGITAEFKEAALNGERMEVDDFNDAEIERRLLRAVQARLEELKEARRALPAKE